MGAKVRNMLRVTATMPPPQPAEKSVLSHAETMKRKPPVSELARASTSRRNRRFPKGDRKALWSRPQARNPLRSQKRYSKIPCQQSERPCPRNQGHGVSYHLPCHRIKLVAIFGFSGGSSPCLRARSMHLMSQAMFLPRLVMVCKPSASWAASSAALPWMLFQ